MCRAIACNTCGKTTWAGCGQHVSDVMRHIPAAQRCKGHEDEPSKESWFARLFSR